VNRDTLISSPVKHFGAKYILEYVFALLDSYDDKKPVLSDINELKQKMKWKEITQFDKLTI